MYLFWKYTGSIVYKHPISLCQEVFGCLGYCITSLSKDLEKRLPHLCNLGGLFPLFPFKFAIQQSFSGYRFDSV